VSAAARRACRRRSGLPWWPRRAHAGRTYVGLQCEERWWACAHEKGGERMFTPLSEHRFTPVRQAPVMQWGFLAGARCRAPRLFGGGERRHTSVGEQRFLCTEPEGAMV